MSKISIEQILFSSFIKYEKLQELTTEAFKNSRSNEVNIYIDLYDMIKRLYDNDVAIENYSIVTSSVINLCAHMRNYYDSRHNVKTNIFIVYSTNDSDINSTFYMNYNKKFKLKQESNAIITDMINNNINLLETLCPYLPDIYFINGNMEPAVLIFDIICKEEASGNMNPNIILTKDVYCYQLPAINTNTVIFRSKKEDGKDISWLVDNRLAINVYLNQTREHTFHWLDFNGGLLSLVMTMSNVPSRNITSLFNIKTTLNKITSLLEQNKILNAYNSDIHGLFNLLNEDGKFPISYIEFENRFKSIDLIYQHMIYMSKLGNAPALNYKINLYDPNAVRAINDMYFKTNPLDLNRL